MMETIASQIASLFENAETYLYTNVELFKLKAIGKLADVVSQAVSTLIFVVFAIMVAFILNIGLALWLGEMTGKTYYGFFILAGFYTLIGIIFFCFRVRLIKQPINHLIITKMQKDA